MEPERTRQGGIRVKTREDAVAACMTLGGCYEDYPFDDPNWTVMRHCGSRRSFALIFEREGRIWVNVKAEPMWGEHWRRTYPAVVQGYHMNKQYWISIILDGRMTDEEILPLIAESWALTAPKGKLGKVK